MIEVIHFQNEVVEKPFEKDIATYYDQVRTLLPALPETIKIYFGDYGIIPESGVGAFAYSRDIITISLDPKFADKARQAKDIRPSVFHEAFHLVQDFTGASQRYSALEGSIYEGMATVFEREHAATLQPYGDYSNTPTEKLIEWAESLRRVDSEYHQNEAISSAWKFYHPEIQERWIAYKVGAWITDQVLQDKNLTILDLSHRTAADVLQLFDTQ